MLSFSISYPALIKLPYFRTSVKEGIIMGERRPKDRVTVGITLFASVFADHLVLWFLLSAFLFFSFFFWFRNFAKMRIIKKLKGLFCCNIPISSFLKLPHFEKHFEVFSAHLEDDFSLVEFLKTSFLRI